MTFPARSDRGFGAVEIIVIIVIVAVLITLGVVGYRAFFGSDDGTKASSADIEGAQRTTQAFYAAYTNSNGQGAAILQQYGTADLIAASKAGDKSYSPIVCAQNVAPVSTGTPTYASGRYAVPVTLNFSTPLTFKVEVVKEGDTFKVDKVDCPPREAE